MKKIQIFFALAAIVVSGAGVFANSLVTTLYFQSTDPGANCNEPLTIGLPTENCDGNAIPQCSKIVAGEEGQVTWYFSKQVDEEPCVEVKREQ